MSNFNFNENGSAQIAVEVDQRGLKKTLKTALDATRDFVYRSEKELDKISESANSNFESVAAAARKVDVSLGFFGAQARV